MPTFLNQLVLFLELSGRCGASSRRSCGNVTFGVDVGVLCIKRTRTSTESDFLAQTAGKDLDRGDALRRRRHTTASASAKTTQYSRRGEASNLEMVPTTPPERQLEPR